MERRLSAEDIELAYEAFNLGMNVVWHAWDVGREPGSAAKLEQAWDAVRDIAESRLTLVPSPEEMLAKFPNAPSPSDVHERLTQHLPALRSREREVAALIADHHEKVMRKLAP